MPFPCQIQHKMESPALQMTCQQHPFSTSIFCSWVSEISPRDVPAPRLKAGEEEEAGQGSQRRQSSCRRKGGQAQLSPRNSSLLTRQNNPSGEEGTASPLLGACQRQPLLLRKRSDSGDGHARTHLHGLQKCQTSPLRTLDLCLHSPKRPH